MACLLLNGQPLFSAGQPADIQAVLFDKDGTMSRSEPHLLALAAARVQHCLNLVEPWEREELSQLLRRAYGLRNQDDGLNPAGITAVAARDHNLIGTAVALTLVGHGWPESLALAEETFRRADQDPAAEAAAAQITEGLVDLLIDLRRHGVRCAVISNDGHDGIRDFLAHHSLSEHIDAIWSADRLPRKPDPRAVNHLCDNLGVPPGQCALIGDANSDLHMARSAGVALVMGYKGGWREPVPLADAYHQLEHWRELSVAESVEPPPGVSTATRGIKPTT
jgi:phosphoglycolate phosphatase